MSLSFRQKSQQSPPRPSVFVRCCGALGSSARPIFTVFDSMKQVQDAVREAAMRRFERFAEQKLPDMPLFKQVGMQMVLFGAR